jgi:CheY-like chemotaxis protein
MEVVIVDGHPTMRLGLKGLLLATDVRVVGETGDGEEALRLVREARPELVLLGLNLTGGTDGIEVCRRIKDLSEPPRVLIHTDHDFTDDVWSCLVAGAEGSPAGEALAARRREERPHQRQRGRKVVEESQPPDPKPRHRPPRFLPDGRDPPASTEPDTYRDRVCAAINTSCVLGLAEAGAACLLFFYTLPESALAVSPGYAACAGGHMGPRRSCCAELRCATRPSNHTPHRP